ncbi:LOW QUALITY PROTEIN: dnaJ homolog subfamily C member 14 [Patagioenas fasciata]|uniref:LOW QUALITY PROTEIN: dnaJ homolog subfamily C member 14 n=1 Tax=Patagioenas fasciata TaxID=372321 RepID=UPI003A99235A
MLLRCATPPEVGGSCGRKAEVRWLRNSGGGREVVATPRPPRAPVRRDGCDLEPAGQHGAAGMEQPRHREAAAAEGSGRSRESPGGGGSAAVDSAATNGSCGRSPAPGLEDEDDEHDLPGPSCSCRCWGEAAALSSRAAERPDGSCSLSCRRQDASGTREDEDGTGTRRPQRRQRQHSAPKEKENGRRRDSTAGRRHRPPRRRSRGDRAELPGLAEEPAGYQGLPASYRGLLARVLRLGTEAGERLLGSYCCFGDRGSVRGWRRQAARWLGAGARFILRLLWLLLALLLLLLVLLLGCLRLGAAAVAAGTVQLAGTRRVVQLLEAAAALHRTWGLLGDSGTWHRLRDWLQGGGTQQGGDAAPSCAGGAPGAGEETQRLLAAANIPEEQLNPFQVLGVEATASDAELRRAYRRLAVLVHPDKNEHPRAEAAFKVLRAAWDIVSSPERRREYELKRLAEQELSRSVGAFLSRLQDNLRDAMNTMMCSKCQGKHKRFELERDPLSARYCGECGGLHPAEEGDFWAESSLLGLKITYLAMMEGKIYDITEWAGCQRVGIAPDTHRVPYHISCGSRGAARHRSVWGAPGGRGRSWLSQPPNPLVPLRNTPKSAPPSAADLQDFFTRVFQGGPGAAAGGGPFPPPPPAPPSRAEGTGPKGEAKHKRRKKVRRPFQR